MHVGIMESTTRPFDGIPGQAIGDAHSRADVLGRQSTYMTNMVLPEMVKSSKNFPLGPDCVITREEVPDQKILMEMDLYWLISQEKGCVECRVMVDVTGIDKKAMTHDPRVIITRKPRRFEAYCCVVCRQNFVTVVQALLHMKAYHRKGKKILIQDQNVFHDIEKAMEVPPVPLPWYVSKRAAEQHPTIMGSTSDGPSSLIAMPITSHTNTNETDISPLHILLEAIVKEYNKPIKKLVFGKDFAFVNIEFEDMRSLTAYLPDLSYKGSVENEEIDESQKLCFSTEKMKSESEGKDICVVRANNAPLARKLFLSALKRSIASSPNSNLTAHDGSDKSTKSELNIDKDDKSIGSPSTSVKLDSRGRPSKTVRFMIGSPDSDEEGSSSASERIGGRDSASPIAYNNEIATTTVITEVQNSSSDEKITKDDEGLKGVVSQLISTASKGIIHPVPPVPTPSSTKSSDQEEAISSLSFRTSFLPKNLSVPNLSSISSAVASSVKSSIVTTSPTLSAGLVRVQSWGGLNPNNRLKHTYTPYPSMHFDNLSRDELRRTFAVGRNFTYAEKIKLMNKLNDEDTLITQEHVKGKLVGGETSRVHIPGVASSPSIQQSVILEKPRSSTVIASGSKLKKSESDSGAKLFSGSEIRKKRRSKYDVDRFAMTTADTVTSPRYTMSASSKDNLRSSSDGSISDREEGDDNPPTLLGLLRTNMNRTSLLSGQTVTPSSSVMSETDYYGSGEWANTAMQTIKILQSTVNASKTEEHSSPKYSEPEQKSSTVSQNTPFVNIISSTGSETSAIVPPFVPLPGSSSSGAMDTIVALAQQITSEQAHLKHLRHNDMSSSHSNQKRALSPHQTDEEHDPLKPLADISSDEPTSKRLKIEKNPSSESSESTSSPTKKCSEIPASHVIAEEGDSLIFANKVTGSSLQDSNKILMKFSKSSSSDASDARDMDMPNIFANSVDTFMKVRYIEKLGRCKVCGFSTPIDTADNSEVLKSHVMEHSLKELIQAGCNGKQLL